ncbi:MAG TPA: hypothetical protein DCY72_05555, partial [Ruminococcaceae bacterium]|nr:hypothetical protein [Oscillospiraceae bacterium]
MSFDTLTVNGGDVAVDTNADYAIGASGNIAVNGGTVSAKGKSAGVHSAGGKITLSWTDTADSIYANSYSGSVEMKKPFIDSADHRYEAGAIEDNTAINNKTLFATHEHAYGDPAWTWTDDHKGASAKFTCSVCQHEETRTAAVTCELIDHICTEPGDNKYTAKVTFGESDFTDVQTIHVSVTEHTYDSGKTLLQAHCMKDGLKRYTCTLCHTKRDERVPCRGSHIWTAREVDYEELKEDDLQSSAHSHFDLNSNGSSGKKYILKECKNCDTRLIEAPDGNKYVRFDQDSWSKDAANCASQSDVSALANLMASAMAEEVLQLGAAAGVAVSSQNVEAVLGASFALFAIAFTAIGVKFSEDSSGKNECDHIKTKVTTKTPTCEDKGVYEIVCYKCGRVFDTGEIDALGHIWSNWQVSEIDDTTMTVTLERTCTRCGKKEEKKEKIAVAELMIQYSDDGKNYVTDTYSEVGTGAHCKCSVAFTDYTSWLSCTPTHAVDYENASDSFTFSAYEKNGYEFVGWYHNDGSELTDQSDASASKEGRNVYYARFKKRKLDIEYKLYDDADKSGGAQNSGKLTVSVKGKTYEKSFAAGQSSCTISIDHEYLTNDAEFNVTLTMDPKDKCAFVKDVRTDYIGDTVRGEKNRRLSRTDDGDIHVMK